jgi:hypothetical protein
LFNKKVSKMSNIKPPYPAQVRQQMVELVQAGRSASEHQELVELRRKVS